MRLYYIIRWIAVFLTRGIVSFLIAWMIIGIVTNMILNGVVSLFLTITIMVVAVGIGIFIGIAFANKDYYTLQWRARTAGSYTHTTITTRGNQTHIDSDERHWPGRD